MISETKKLTKLTKTEKKVSLSSDQSMWAHTFCNLRSPLALPLTGSGSDDEKEELAYVKWEEWR